MPILTQEQALAHCRADSVADGPMVTLYLQAAIDAAQDYLGRKLYADAVELELAEDETGMVASGSVKAAILLTCGHLFANRESVVVGYQAGTLPMGAHDLLRPHRLGPGL